MLGTNAPLVVDLALLVTLLAPMISQWSVRYARVGALETHRYIQTGILLIAVAAVLALEIQIRITGGAGALVQGSSFAGTPLLASVTTTHILGAILTYLAWITLVWLSYRKYRTALPGHFSRIHVRIGQTVLFGLYFTAASAIAVYVLGFVW